jgi:hypothetical protein
MPCFSLETIIGAMTPFYIGNDIEKYESHYLFSSLDTGHYFSGNTTVIHN